MFLFLSAFFCTLFLPFAHAQVTPFSPEEDKRWNLSLQKEFIVSEFDSQPVDQSKIQPPLITLKAWYFPNLERSFQPEFMAAISILEGFGQYGYFKLGGWFDWSKIHLFFGLEYFNAFDAGEYEVSPIDHRGSGLYLKIAAPMGRFYPSIEFRTRRIEDNEIANREGIGTLVGYNDGTIFRPELTVALEDLKLWGALSIYRMGTTGIASQGFALGIEGETFYSLSVGAGFELWNGLLWVKTHRLEGVKDEVAHQYMAPQIYPDFLLAEQTLSVEFIWQL
jgi:hypothetical protein